MLPMNDQLLGYKNAATEIGHIESFRPKRFAQRYGVDPLLTLVVVVTALYGLIVLYSASGQNISMVVRQASVIAGLGIMIVVSQARRDTVIHITPFVSVINIAGCCFVNSVDVKGHSVGWIYRASRGFSHLS